MRAAYFKTVSLLPGCAGPVAVSSCSTGRGLVHRNRQPNPADQAPTRNSSRQDAIKAQTLYNTHDILRAASPKTPPQLASCPGFMIRTRLLGPSKPLFIPRALSSPSFRQVSGGLAASLSSSYSEAALKILTWACSLSSRQRRSRSTPEPRGKDGLCKKKLLHHGTFGWISERTLTFGLHTRAHGRCYLS